MKNLNLKKWLSRPTYKVVIIVLIAFVLGYLIRGWRVSSQLNTEHIHAAQDKEQIWTCSMHPQIRQPKPGKCDICQMNLVTTESLGFLKAELPDQAPLVIPATAALITGKRAVVYVRKLNAEKPTFEGREVILGPRAGDYYLVKTGLTEGEVVVSKGNFKIDSALQIQAKPSMMSPQGQKAPMEHHEHNH